MLCCSKVSLDLKNKHALTFNIVSKMPRSNITVSAKIYEVAWLAANVCKPATLALTWFDSAIYKLNSVKRKGVKYRFANRKLETGNSKYIVKREKDATKLNRPVPNTTANLLLQGPKK
jgi:hypothetical protein